MESREGDELAERLPDETCGAGRPGASPAAPMRDLGPVDAYRRAAPLVLTELSRLLSQHRRTGGSLPHGVVNILNYSWQDATAGAVHPHSPGQTPKRRKPSGSWRARESPRQESANGGREAGESDLKAPGSSGPSDRKLKVGSNPRVKRRKQKSSGAHNSSVVSISISSSSLKGGDGCDLCPGWIIQPKLPSYDEPQWISLCQWAVERLQTARNHQKLQTAGQNLSKPLILRHYGETRAKLKDSARRKDQPATFVNGIPQIPQVKLQDPAWQKLHYRINDGSSFIYYPSGGMAVCQSHSGLSCGGLYTNVFSDGDCSVVLATITAFGHGAVTHPVSSSITAVWDQDGGFISDRNGNITKQWNWQTDRAPKEKIVIQLSDVISVMLLSGTSATLTFMCSNESVQLPLSALSAINQSKETLCLKTDGKFISDAAQDLLLASKTNSPTVVLESKRNLTLTPVYARSQEASQVVREMDWLVEPSAQWRRGGRGEAPREVKRLQQRVRNTLEDWLDYYRAATGIKCPERERMPTAPLRTRLRGGLQSAALPPPNPPEWADAKAVQPEESGNELQELQRHLSVSAERAADSPVRLPRTPKKQVKTEPRIIEIGPLQIHGNIKLESVIIPKSPESQPAAVTRCPAPSSFTPSVPLTVCPVLLRAALLGEGKRRRCCCCSVTLMPVVTDLEYDTFVMGQPPHSQQILVVCVTVPHQPNNNTNTVPGQDMLEQLYRKRNKHRAMPCTQCQMDSFRLVRYEMPAGTASCRSENILLQQRHNAAPGMALMYIKGKLLFVGYIFSGCSCSVRDLQKQISKTRGDYRLGLSLPPDYKFSDTVDNPAASDATFKGGDVVLQPASAEKADGRKKHRGFTSRTQRLLHQIQEDPISS